jgi:CheY-like chemotaxis protein
VTVAASGEEALALLERQTFDVVLMDVQMPEMDGLEATRRIRRRERENGRRVPIVAMTAYALKGDRERCLEAGMDDYVAKPIRTPELFEILTRVVHRTPRPEAACGLVRPAAKPLAAHDDDFNPTAALKHVGGDRKLLCELIALFVRDSQRWLADLRAAVQRRDAGEMRRWAHNFKGALVHFELGRAINLAQTLEFLGRNANLDGAELALNALERELDRVRPQLTAYTGTAKTRGTHGDDPGGR